MPLRSRVDSGSGFWSSGVKINILLVNFYYTCSYIYIYICICLFIYLLIDIFISSFTSQQMDMKVYKIRNMGCVEGQMPTCGEAQLNKEIKLNNECKHVLLQ